MEDERNMLRRFLRTVSDYGICIYLVMILAVMPLYNRQGYSHIGTDKSYFFNTVTVRMGSILLPVVLAYLIVTAVSMGREWWKGLRRSLSLTDLFAAGYALAVSVSWLCSDYRRDVFWGASGWYMGFCPQIFLILIYFFVSKLWKPRAWMYYLMLGTSGLVFLLGYLNRLGIDPLGMGIDNPDFISTVGNINWYCGYLVSVFFAGAVLLWRWEGARTWQQYLLLAYVAVGFGTLVTQGSDSGLVTLAAMLLILFVMSAPDRDRMLMFWWEMLLLGVVCLITGILRKLLSVSAQLGEGFGTWLTAGWLPIIMTIVSAAALIWIYRGERNGIYPKKGWRVLARSAVLTAVGAVSLFGVLAAVNTVRPGSLGPLSDYSVFTFSPQWGSNRGATWAAGLRCFWEQDPLHKLVGAGPDAMSAYLYRDGSEGLLELVRERFGKLTLCNAHNEWLTVLVNTGLLGLAAFAGMMVTAIRTFFREGKRNKIVCACGFCLLAYTVNNAFSFQQAMNAATVFVIFGMGGAFLRESGMQQ